MRRERRKEREGMEGGRREEGIKRGRENYYITLTQNVISREGAGGIIHTEQDIWDIPRLYMYTHGFKQH